MFRIDSPLSVVRCQWSVVSNPLSFRKVQATDNGLLTTDNGQLTDKFREQADTVIRFPVSEGR